MAARKVRESYDGGTVEVATGTCPLPGCTAGASRVVLDVTERGMGRATLHLTPGEARDLVDEIERQLAADQATYADSVERGRAFAAALATAKAELLANSRAISAPESVTWA